MSYYDFCESIRFSLSWQSLKYKYENNIESEEFLFYQLLDDEASCFALNVNLNHNLVSCLSRVHGFCFGNYGVACWRVIKRFLEDINYQKDIETIKALIVKRRIKSVRAEAPSDLNAYVDELFSNNPKTIEVKLVRELHRVLKSLQPIKNIDLKLFYELEEKIISEIKENYLLNKDIIEVDLSKFIPSDMPKINDILDEVTENSIYDNLVSNLKLYSEKYQEYSYDEHILIAISVVLED